MFDMDVLRCTDIFVNIFAQVLFFGIFSTCIIGTRIAYIIVDKN